jgi:hypothetical protein
MSKSAEQLAQEDRQLAYSLRVLAEGPNKVLVDADGKREGSEAIAYGRGAAIALERGDKETASRMWKAVAEASPVAQLDPVFPSIEKFVAGAKQNVDAVKAAFGKEAGFANDLAVSNAAGSYAFAADATLRGNAAFVGGGELGPTKDWGMKALMAAGFPEAALELNNRLTQREQRAGASKNI